MIRRRTTEGFLLIPQAQHARMAGDIAQNLGGVLTPPSKPDELAKALKIHAVGFDAFDAKLPLNAAGRPMNFDEIPLIVLLAGWHRSSELALAGSPYQAMLVSLLSLQRSAAVATAARSLRETFEINKHQQREVEIQATLRPQLGLRSDVPLRNGLPETGIELLPAEQVFIYDYRLMLFSIQLALELCARRRTSGDLTPTPAKPAGEKVTVSYGTLDNTICTLTPFPLTQLLHLQVIAKLLPAQAYDHELELHESLETTPTHILQVSLRPGQSS